MRVKIYWGELAFVFGTVSLTLGIALQTRADMGVSMVAAPAYILSLKFDSLTFGRAEFLVQGLLFLAYCIVVRQIRYKKLMSFVVAVPYGILLDLCMKAVLFISPNTMLERLLIFLSGTVLSALGIALYFRTYLPMLVYEMFVMGMSRHYNVDFNKVKIIYDWTSFFTAVILSLWFFKGFYGIGLGTILCTILNGPLIKQWGKLLDNHIDFKPMCKLNK